MGSTQRLDLFLVVRTPAGVRRPVGVQISANRPVADLVSELSAHLGVTTRPLTAYLPGRRITATKARDIAGLDLRMGDELWLVNGDSERLRHPGPPESPWELVIVGGPLAGHVFSLKIGEQTLGRGANADLRLVDSAVSRMHVRLSVVDDAVMLSPVGPRACVYLDGRPISRGHRALPDQVFEIGHSLLCIRSSTTDGEARPRPSSGRIRFNRPPTAAPTAIGSSFELPSPPAELPGHRIPLAAALAPLFLGAAIWIATRSVLGLLLALGTPLMAVAPLLEDRIIGRWRRRREARRYMRQVADDCERLGQLRLSEVQARRSQAPDAAELERRASLALPTLWERQPDRPGFLRLRLGWGDFPSEIKVPVPAAGRQDLREHALAVASAGALLAAVPVNLDLSKVGSLGVVGPASGVEGFVRWLIAQAATLHLPDELSLAAFVTPRCADDWEWLSWLPHGRGGGLDPDAPTVAVTASDHQRLAAALEEHVAREEQSREAAAGAALVLVHEDARVARAQLAPLLRRGGSAGVFMIWQGSSRLMLPEGCGAVAEISDSGTCLRLTLINTAEELNGVPDLVDLDYAERVARSLSGIQAEGSGGARAALPRAIGLIDCLSLGDRELREAITQWWTASEPDLAAPIGVGEQGILSLDLRNDGPHALVGGTSGSGKSEFLRAWVTALAARHSPRRLNFLLVDFKGGTAFQDCARLPHVVGVVTDLSEHHLGRIEMSLLAELKRRESVMAGFGQKEFHEFELHSPDHAPPALVVVFDEFEQLLAEHPGFVSAVIVPIARLGRGLGVHLVLGTQKPQGSVPEAIRSNTNIRVALRMLSEAHSRDVIDSPEAARIPPDARGRACLRLSHQSLRSLQVAYSGARRESRPSGAIVREFHSANSNRRAPGPSSQDSEGASDFERLVEAMAVVSAELCLTAPPPPWLPPLPEVLPLIDLRPPLDVPNTCAGALLGTVDEPRRQAQWTFTHSFKADGHLLAYGSAQSGKSTLLRTLAYSLASASPPSTLWIYGLDFSGGAIRALEQLPHVGGIATADDPERVAQVLRMLTREAAVRHREVHQTPRPEIVLLIDEFATFRAVFERIDGGRYVDLLEALVRDGRALGIYCAITTSQRRDLSGLLASAVPRRLLLRPDRQEAEALGLPPHCRREAALPPGRGFVDGRLEVQIADLTDGSPTADNAAVCDFGARFAGLDIGGGPPRIEVLPRFVKVADMPPPSGRQRATIGLGGDTVVPQELDFDLHGHLVVCGPRGSGRTTALKAAAASLGRAGLEQRLILMSPRRRSEPEIGGTWSRVAIGIEACTELALELCREEGAAMPPTVVIVDDGEMLMEGAADSALRQLTRLGREQPVRLIAAVEVRAVRRYSEWMAELKESRHALLLNPDVTADGEPFGTGPLPRPLRPWPPGRGFLISQGQIAPIQVASE